MSCGPGTPWRDLPESFGKWFSVYQRFRRWVIGGVFDRIFEGTNGLCDFRVVMVDGSFVKVHQHGTGARRNGATPDESANRQGIGRSRGGLTSKIMALTDKNGRLCKFSVVPGNAYEGKQLSALLDGIQTKELIADKAYDSNSIRQMLAGQNIVSTIPSKGKPYNPHLARPRPLPNPPFGGELVWGFKAVEGRCNTVLQATPQLCGGSLYERMVSVNQGGGSGYEATAVQEKSWFVATGRTDAVGADERGFVTQRNVWLEEHQVMGLERILLHAHDLMFSPIPLPSWPTFRPVITTGLGRHGCAGDTSNATAITKRLFRSVIEPAICGGSTGSSDRPHHFSS